MAAALRRFHPILEAARRRSASDSDTATIVADFLGEALGYDKYAEVTRERALLTVLLDQRPRFVIVVAASAEELGPRHAELVAAEAAGRGAPFGLVSNGLRWRAYAAAQGEAARPELVLDLDLAEAAQDPEPCAGVLYLLAREGVLAGALPLYHRERRATDRYVLAAVLASEAVLEVVRRELRRLDPALRVDPELVRDALLREVLQPALLEGEQAELARARLRRARVAGPAAAPTAPEPLRLPSAEAGGG